MNKEPGQEDLQDFIVAMHVAPMPDFIGQSRKPQAFQVMDWQGIIPNEHPELHPTGSSIIIHTAPHGIDRIVKPAHDLAVGKGSFCGWDKPLSFLQLELSPSSLQGFTAELGILVPPSRQDVQVLHTHEPKLIQLGAWLLEEIHKGGEIGRLSVDSLVNLLALQIFDLSNQWSERLPQVTPSLPVSLDSAASPNAALSPEVARVIAFMQAHLERDISLVELSQIAHISPSHLGRLFKRFTHLTPHQYLIHLRVAHASELLRSGRLSIAEVALQSGFDDQSHLNRHFKRIYGMTPKVVFKGS